MVELKHRAKELADRLEAGDDFKGVMQASHRDDYIFALATTVLEDYLEPEEVEEIVEKRQAEEQINPTASLLGAMVEYARDQNAEE